MIILTKIIFATGYTQEYSVNFDGLVKTKSPAQIVPDRNVALNQHCPKDHNNSLRYMCLYLHKNRDEDHPEI